MAKTKDERHKEIHQEALHEFSDIQEAQRDERLQMIEDRRFVTIAGAQWEGDDNFAKQFENKPHLEVNMIQLSIIRIYNEYRNGPDQFGNMAKTNNFTSLTGENVSKNE